MSPRLIICLLTAALVAAAAPAARAATAGHCTVGEARACVLLVEVDGLEPQDVTPTTTPFLWALAHPEDAIESDPVGAVGAALGDRTGYIWGAARGVMQAGTAPATAALLTGSEPLGAGIPSDEFLSGSLRWLEGTTEESLPEFKGAL